MDEVADPVLCNGQDQNNGGDAKAETTEDKKEEEKKNKNPGKALMEYLNKNK